MKMYLLNQLVSMSYPTRTDHFCHSKNSFAYFT